MNDEELRGLLERGIRAIESLAEDPVIQMQVGPPVCPHCETINPTVLVRESEGVGALGEFVIRAECQLCRNVFFAMPVQWECARNTDEATQLQKERFEINGLNSREDQRAPS